MAKKRPETDEEMEVYLQSRREELSQEATDRVIAGTRKIMEKAIDDLAELVAKEENWFASKKLTGLAINPTTKAYTHPGMLGPVAATIHNERVNAQIEAQAALAQAQIEQMNAHTEETIKAASLEGVEIALTNSEE